MARALFSAYPHIGLIPGQFLLQRIDSVLTSICSHIYLFSSLPLPFYFQLSLSSSVLILLFADVRRDKEKMQQFFEKYATAYNFDPLVPANWYRQAATKIIAFKVNIEESGDRRDEEEEGDERWREEASI